MNRLQEIDAKHEKIRALLAHRQAGGLWIRRTRNLAWITAGADASIPVETDYGMYSILITPEKRVVYTNNIEITRLRDEDALHTLGFDYQEFPWYGAAAQPDLPNLLVDEGDVEGEIQQLRWVLLPPEQDRLRALGRDAALAIDEAARAVKPGDTEFDIASRLDAACRKRGGMAIVNLIASDSRISSYRHPLPTMKKIEKYGMLVVCMRRGGLIVSATRLIHFGPAPADLKEKNRKVASVDAAAIVNTQPGKTLGDVFSAIQAAYAAQGEDGQWQYHHQGGSAGYGARERVATPGDTTPIQVGQAFAWNPSIVGSKSEDTILLTEAGFEIVTEAPLGWPMLDIQVEGKWVKRAGILEL
jgi:Xaa-Pro aminopeptidase